MLQTHGQQGAQHTATVHREGRQKIEHDKDHVDGEKFGQKVAAAFGHFLQITHAEKAAEHDVEPEGDDHVDRGTGQCDDEFLPRFVRHALESRDAANGEECDVRRVDAVSAGRQGMTEFVQDHADEKQDDERKPDNHGPVAALRVIDETEPRQQQEKRGVDAHVDAGDPRQLERPLHARERPPSRPSRQGQTESTFPAGLPARGGSFSARS